MHLVDLSRQLCQSAGALRFGAPVTHVYNPLDYAREVHEAFLRRFGEGTGRAVLVGMNPGPWGMAQTGVPFGEVEHVRDWMRLDGVVHKPDKEHPKRPVEGLLCSRSEVSGRRLWAWARERFVTPEAFFERFFVLNYCPLVFMEASGRNRTPDKLSAAERTALTEVCDQALADAVQALRPSMVIGVGAYARQRAQSVLSGVPVAQVLHPSPASPVANRGWAAQAEAQFQALGVI